MPMPKIVPMTPMAMARGFRTSPRETAEIAAVTAWILEVVATIDCRYARLPAGEIPGVRRAPAQSWGEQLTDVTDSVTELTESTDEPAYLVGVA
ncbi:MAG: hypothetical protein NVS3B21_29610 [Acidimicrobiales bacterium]